MQKKIDTSLMAHREILERDVFHIKDKWPHFQLLLNDIADLSEKAKAGDVVVSLERTLLYGGYSMVAPFFSEQEFISIDCSPESADKRGAYNKKLVNDVRFIKIKNTKRASIENTGLEDNLADLVLIPNLVHHVADQERLFHEMARILKPGGIAYVFEPLVRELHQIPDDYLRYTPFGLSNIMEKVGLRTIVTELEGGPFSAIAYCWTQALQYFPEGKRVEMEEWFYGEHFSQLMDWDEQYKENKFRPHTQFPMSFSVQAKKEEC